MLNCSNIDPTTFEEGPIYIEIEVFMSIKEKKFTVRNSASFDDREPESSVTPVEPSSARLVLAELTHAINQNDVDEFKAIISNDFIYPGDGLKEGDTDLKGGTTYPFIIIDGQLISFPESNSGYIIHDHYSATFKGGHHVRSFEYRYYSARPMIEALFYEHNKLFRDLVELLAESDNALLHHAFIRSFNKTDVSTDIFVPWDQNVKCNVKAGIKEIKNYGEFLHKAGISRGSYALQLANDLRERMNTLPDSENTYTDKVKWLDFKYKFVTSLHSQDSHFVTHRGWKRIISNIASIIFSAGILNLINFCATGNFFFFNKTTTLQLVYDVDKSAKVERLAM